MANDRVFFGEDATQIRESARGDDLKRQRSSAIVSRSESVGATAWVMVKILKIMKSRLHHARDFLQSLFI